MNAMPSADPRRSKATARAWRAAALAALLSPGVGSHLSAQEEPVSAQEPAPAGKQQIVAVLKLQEMDFFYRTSSAPLSCGDIQGRVASILVSLGARRDIDVRVNGCDLIGSSGDFVPRAPSPEWPESESWRTSARPWDASSGQVRSRIDRNGQSAHVRVRALMPVEVTPEVVAEIRKDKSRRDLVSRVTGNPAASLNDPIMFPAQRQQVTLSQHTVGLEPEDCQLLEQMSRLFSKFDIRIVRRGPTCGRDEESRLAPRMTVEALMPVMPPTPQLAPEAGESEPDPGAPAASGTTSPEPAAAPQPE